MVCITRDALSTREYSKFKEYTGKLSKTDVATLVETMNELLVNNDSGDIESVYRNDKGQFLFLLSPRGSTDFDFYSYVNSHYFGESNVNCANVRFLFPQSLSMGTYVEGNYDEDSTDDIDNEATGYIDEEELGNVIQKDLSYALKSISTGEKIKLSDIPLVIGRSAKSADYVISGTTNVSRKHCELWSRGGRVYIRDLGSLNGTFIGNRRLQPQQQEVLGEGDVIYIAEEKFILERA